MSFEIERKFLVIGRDWQKLAIARTRIRQAYLAAEGALSIRVRIKEDHAATLTVKSRGAELRRLELEYPIPTTDAEALMARRHGSVIEKVRHDIPWHGLMWEVDVFAGGTRDWFLPRSSSITSASRSICLHGSAPR